MARVIAFKFKLDPSLCRSKKKKLKKGGEARVFQKIHILGMVSLAAWHEMNSVMVRGLILALDVNVSYHMMTKIGFTCLIYPEP